MYDHLIDTDCNRCVKCQKSVTDIVEEDVGCIRATTEADFPAARRGQLRSTGQYDQPTNEEPSHGADPNRPEVRDRS